MNIYLDKQLKKLRKEKGTTQEELAAHLGITTQAVSKWERNESYPDITLLPAIASYYNVSVDDLLGVDAIEKERKIERYREQNEELGRAGKSEDRVALLREAKREFPNDLSVLYDLMYALQAENQKENADEIIEYGKRILEESTDNTLRNGAIQSLSLTYYYGKDDAESAKKYASMAGIYSVTVNELMPRFLEGDEAVQYCQCNIQELVDMISLNTDTLVLKGQYGAEDMIKAYRFVIDCYSLLYSDGNCGFYHCRLWQYYKKMADNYLELGKVDEMFACLEKAAEHTVKYDTLKDGTYTAFMVNKVELSVDNAYKNYTENDSSWLMALLNEEKLIRWRDDHRMQAIIAKLKPIARI